MGWKSKIKAPADLVFSGGLFSGSQMAFFFRDLRWQRGKGAPGPLLYQL